SGLAGDRVGVSEWAILRGRHHLPARPAPRGLQLADRFESSGRCLGGCSSVAQSWLADVEFSAIRSRRNVRGGADGTALCANGSWTACRQSSGGRRHYSAGTAAESAVGVFGRAGHGSADNLYPFRRDVYLRGLGVEVLAAKRNERRTASKFVR